MTSKHTPWPWSVYVRKGAAMSVGPSHNCTVATVCCPPVGDAEANARLIATAPELLEALRGLDEAYCRAGDSLSREERAEDRKRLMAARAAIAKATGEGA